MNGNVSCDTDAKLRAVESLIALYLNDRKLIEAEHEYLW